jgi:hypothetical protein
MTTTSASDDSKAAPGRSVAGKLDRLRTELADMAFALDRRGHPEAADVAMTLFGRVGEIVDELAQER